MPARSGSPKGQVFIPHVCHHTAKHLPDNSNMQKFYSQNSHKPKWLPVDSKSTEIHRVFIVWLINILMGGFGLLLGPYPWPWLAFSGSLFCLTLFNFPRTEHCALISSLAQRFRLALHKMVKCLALHILSQFHEWRNVTTRICCTMERV